MWKTLTRGFRETFERGLNFGRNHNSRVHNETQKTKFYQCYARPTCFLTTYRNRRRCQEGCNDNEGPKEDRAHYETYDAFDSWLGAFSCSSATALGWFLSQPYNWNKWLCDRPAERERAVRSACSLVGVLAKVAISQPPVSPVQGAIENSDKYGPLTAEEALDEAADKFLSVHNSILGVVENKKAIALIEGPRKDERKAIQLFLSASKKGYIPATYNLGQCYELGIGTKQDFHEAAKWYQKAADGGHPTATYNLAVFYAHGWGGLEASTGKARELLKAAAALGQSDAAAALGISKETLPPSSIPDIPEEILMDHSQVPPLEDASCDPEELFKMANSFENSPCDDTTQPHLVLQLYKMAADLGHKEAKMKYNILQSYNTVGLLSEYLCRGSKPSSESFSSLKLHTVF